MAGIESNGLLRGPADRRAGRTTPGPATTWSAAWSGWTGPPGRWPSTTGCRSGSTIRFHLRDAETAHQRAAPAARGPAGRRRPDVHLQRPGHPAVRRGPPRRRGAASASVGPGAGGRVLRRRRVRPGRRAQLRPRRSPRRWPCSATADRLRRADRRSAPSTSGPDAAGRVAGDDCQPSATSRTRPATATSSSSASTSSGAWPWTRPGPPTPATRARPWPWPRWPTCCSPG